MVEYLEDSRFIPDQRLTILNNPNPTGWVKPMNWMIRMLQRPINGDYQLELTIKHGV
jgi:hypothetical protein